VSVNDKVPKVPQHEDDEIIDNPVIPVKPVNPVIIDSPERPVPFKIIDSVPKPIFDCISNVPVGVNDKEPEAPKYEDDEIIENPIISDSKKESPVPFEIIESITKPVF